MSQSYLAEIETGRYDVSPKIVAKLAIALRHLDIAGYACWDDNTEPNRTARRVWTMGGHIYGIDVVSLLWGAAGAAALLFLQWAARHLLDWLFLPLVKDWWASLSKRNALKRAEQLLEYLKSNFEDRFDVVALVSKRSYLIVQLILLTTVLNMCFHFLGRNVDADPELLSFLEFATILLLSVVLVGSQYAIKGPGHTPPPVLGI